MFDDLAHLPITAQMSLRARRLQRAHLERELDLTRESLAELEELVISDVYLCDDDAVLTFGAYLGEVIIGAGEGIEWVDFGRAAAHDPRLTAGGLIAENRAFLASGTELRSPFGQIVELMNHPSDRHLREFADDVIERARMAAPTAAHDAAIAALDAFLDQPSPEHLVALGTHPLAAQPAIVGLRARNVQPEVFYPLLHARAFPRTKAPSRIAATYLGLLARAGHVDVAAMCAALAVELLPGGDDEDTRAAELMRFAAAHARALVLHASGDDAAVIAQYDASDDDGVRGGTMLAIAVILASPDTDVASVSPFLPTVASGLRTHEHRSDALDACISLCDRETELADLVDPLLAVAVDGGYDVDAALISLDAHVKAIRVGRSPFDPRIAAIIAAAKQVPPSQTTRELLAHCHELAASLVGEPRAIVERALAAQ